MVRNEINNAITIPEDEGTGLPVNAADWISAGHIAGLSGQQNNSDYVENGLEFSVSGTELTISGGLAFIYAENTVRVQNEAGQYNRTWDRGVTYAVQVGENTVDLTDNVLNHIYLELDLSKNNGCFYTTETGQDAATPSAPHLRIGTVGLSGSEAVINETNREQYHTLRQATVTEEPTNDNELVRLGDIDGLGAGGGMEMHGDEYHDVDYALASEIAGFIESVGVADGGTTVGSATTFNFGDALSVTEEVNGTYRIDAATADGSGMAMHGNEYHSPSFATQDVVNALTASDVDAVPDTGGEVNGALNVTGSLTEGGEQVYHAGNLDPSSFALASEIEDFITSITVSDSGTVLGASTSLDFGNALSVTENPDGSHTIDAESGMEAHGNEYHTEDYATQADVSGVEEMQMHGDEWHSATYLNQTDLDTHSGVTDAHHTKYTDAEAVAATADEYAAATHGDAAHTEDYALSSEISSFIESITVEQDGTVVGTTASLNFGESLTVTDEGDGTYRIDGESGLEEHDDTYHSVDYATQTELNTHVADTSNPHGVTAEQAGALPDSDGAVTESHLSFDTATQAEIANFIEGLDVSDGVTDFGTINQINFRNNLDVESDGAGGVVIDGAQADSGSGMTTHGNEYHDPDFLTSTALTDHEALTDVHHARYTDADAVAATAGEYAAATHGDAAHSEDYALAAEIADFIESISVSNDGTAVADVSSIDFGTALTPVDNEDGSVTVNAEPGMEEHGDEMHSEDYATSTELTSHAGDADAHHTRYTDTEAIDATAAEYADATHGSEAHSEDYTSAVEFSNHALDGEAHHTRYTDSEAITATAAEYAAATHGDAAHSEDYALASEIADFIESIAITDSGTAIGQTAALDFGNALSVTDNADGTVTVDAEAGMEAHGDEYHTEDYATNSELTTHSGTADAHHAPYTAADAVADTASEYADATHGNEAHTEDYATQTDLEGIDTESTVGGRYPESGTITADGSTTSFTWTVDTTEPLEQANADAATSSASTDFWTTVDDALKEITVTYATAPEGELAWYWSANNSVSSVDVVTHGSESHDPSIPSAEDVDAKVDQSIFDSHENDVDAHHTKYTDAEAVAATAAEYAAATHGDAAHTEDYALSSEISSFIENIGISDSGTAVTDAVSINFGSSLDVTDDGGGAVTVDSVGSGAGVGGYEAQTADGSTTEFRFDPNLNEDPTFLSVDAATEAASTNFSADYDTGTGEIVVTYSAAPQNGDTVAWWWSVDSEIASSGGMQAHGDEYHTEDYATQSDLDAVSGGTNGIYFATSGDTQSVRDALAAANAEAGEVFVPEGTYNVSGDWLTIREGVTLRCSPNAEFVRDDSTLQLLLGNAASGESAGGYTGDSDITVIGGKWDLNYSTHGTNANGMLFANATNINVRDAEIYDMTEWHLLEFNAVNGGTAERCYFHDHDRGTRDADRSEMLELDRAGASSNPMFGADDGTHCQNITIRDCKFENGTGTGIGSHSTNDGSVYDSIHVSNCKFINVEYGLAPINWNNVEVTNCHWDDVLYAFRATQSGSDVQAIKVIGGDITGRFNDGGRALDFVGDGTNDFTDVAVMGVTVRDIGSHGIGFEAISGIVVSNTSVENVAEAGIWAYSSCDRVKFSNNHVDAAVNNRYDIQTGGGSGTATNITITGMQANSIRIISNSDQVQITDSQFSNEMVIDSGATNVHTQGNFVAGTLTDGENQNMKVNGVLEFEPLAEDPSNPAHGSMWFTQ